MVVKSHRELRVYKLAFESASEIHLLTAKFPSEERYGLTDQIRRSSRSVCANIGEAWRKRRYEKSFISKLSDADAEATEVQIWLEFSHRFGYVDQSICDKLTDQYDHVCSQLTIMMNQPEKWINGQ